MFAVKQVMKFIMIATYLLESKALRQFIHPESVKLSSFLHILLVLSTRVCSSKLSIQEKRIITMFRIFAGP